MDLNNKEKKNKIDKGKDDIKNENLNNKENKHKKDKGKDDIKNEDFYNKDKIDNSTNNYNESYEGIK